ncbi:hypothetical protein Q7P37_000790 [Cladosporium fusiforme]
MTSVGTAQQCKSSTNEQSETTNHYLEQENDFDCPEGGFRAWLVVLGAWCAMIPSMGMLNTIGVVDAWISENQLQALPKSQIAWVVSIYAFLLYVGGSCTGECRIFHSYLLDILQLIFFLDKGAIFDRYGLRPVIIPGSIGIVASIMCLSVSTEYFHFLLSFGVLGGLATGIACTAGGIGGMMFSLIILYLAPVIGFPWTMRIIGFICLGACTVACLTLQTRNVRRPNATEAKEPGLFECLKQAVDLRAFASDPPYLATTVAVFLIEFAVFIPLTYISSAAISTGQGLDTEHAYRLIALLNVGSIPGRALPGYVADHFGRFNVMIVTAMVCTVLIFCIWLPPTVIGDSNEPALTAFAVLFGFWSGAAISLTPVCIAQVCKVEEVGRRVGTSFSISSIAALVGVPIGGAIIDADGGGYTGLVIFAGGLYILAVIGFVVARFVAGPKRVMAIY